MTLSEMSVGEVADLIRGANRRGPKLCLLIGAGVSKSAGIGLAGDFVRLIQDKFSNIYARAQRKCGAGKEPSYAECMCELTSAKQVELVREQIDEARINWAHIGIARLEHAGIVDTILTPNFDPLAARACAMFNQFPATYDLAGLRDHSRKRISFDRSYVKGSAIFHLHGQHTGFLLLNTDEKLKAQAKRIRPVLEATMKGKPVIVAGYSGENDPLIEEIADLAPFNHGLFWLRHDHIDPAPNVCERLLSLPDCHLIRNAPSDRFFVDLANALGLGPPCFLVNWYQHMLDVLEKMSKPDEKAPSPSDELLAQAKRRLKESADELSREQSGEKVRALLSTGRHQQVWDEYHDQLDGLSGEDCKLIAWAALALGDELGAQARLAEATERAELDALAIEKYQAALAIDPAMAEAHNNWAANLVNQAHEAGEKAAAMALAAEAVKRSRAALQLRPDFIEAMRNLSSGLLLQARLSERRKAEPLFEEAERLLHDIEDRAPGAGAYNLACYHGIRGRAEGAAEWLRKAKASADCPDCAYIRADPDFRPVLDSPAFRQVLAEVGCADPEAQPPS